MTMFEGEGNNTDDTLTRNKTGSPEQEWHSAHFLTFTFSVLCATWAICANLVIVGCFIWNRKRPWSNFSRQVCSMSVSDLLVALNISLNLVLEQTGRKMNSILCFQLLYSYFAFQCVTLYHVLGICIYRNIKLKSVSEPLNDVKNKLYSFVVIFTSWLFPLIVILIPFIIWYKGSNKEIVCHASEFFDVHLHEAMAYLSLAYFIPQCLTNGIYLACCYRFWRAVRKVVPIQNIEMPLASTSKIPPLSVTPLSEDKVERSQVKSLTSKRTTVSTDDEDFERNLNELETTGEKVDITRQRKGKGKSTHGKILNNTEYLSLENRNNSLSTEITTVDHSSNVEATPTTQNDESSIDESMPKPKRNNFNFPYPDDKIIEGKYQNNSNNVNSDCTESKTSNNTVEHTAREKKMECTDTKVLLNAKEDNFKILYCPQSDTIINTIGSRKDQYKEGSRPVDSDLKTLEKTSDYSVRVLSKLQNATNTVKNTNQQKAGKENITFFNDNSMATNTKEGVINCFHESVPETEMEKTITAIGNPNHVQNVTTEYIQDKVSLGAISKNFVKAIESPPRGQSLKQICGKSRQSNVEEHCVKDADIFPSGDETTIGGSLCIREFTADTIGDETNTNTETTPEKQSTYRKIKNKSDEKIQGNNVFCNKRVNEITSNVNVFPLNVEQANTSSIVKSTANKAANRGHELMGFNPVDITERRTHSLKNINQTRSASSRAYHKRVIGTIGLLLLFFNIFTLPITCLIFVEPSKSTPHDVKVIFGMMFVVNSGLNAIIYATRVPSLRKDIKCIIDKCVRFFRRH